MYIVIWGTASFIQEKHLCHNMSVNCSITMFYYKSIIYIICQSNLKTHFLDIMVGMGYSQEEIQESLSKMKYDEITATYLLLGRKSSEVSKLCKLT